LLTEQNSSLAQDISRLGPIYESLQERLGKLSSQFVNGQLYRHGCKFVSGAKSSGVRSELINKNLELSLLKSAADAGHCHA
jgi:hypothetical protein